ncbi:hypothetical protein [Leptolyngbya ohadii]|uniref:hypothetical protein n=1 Tax=Leptolyngbya ohadii TaxID=1962290 RepID=UPI00117B5786|nr:hypothetical protein [Leptolyngbya ohadii]
MASSSAGLKTVLPTTSKRVTRTVMGSSVEGTGATGGSGVWGRSWSGGGAAAAGFGEAGFGAGWVRVFAGQQGGCREVHLGRVEPGQVGAGGMSALMGLMGLIDRAVCPAPGFA